MLLEWNFNEEKGHYIINFWLCGLELPASPFNYFLIHKWNQVLY